MPRGPFPDGRNPELRKEVAAGVIGMGGILLLVLFLVFSPPASSGPRPCDSQWCPLFDGPPLGKRCVIGALERGMRFYAPNDPARQEWLVLDKPAVLRHPEAVPTPGGLRMDPLDNWPRPVALECVDLSTGEVKCWRWGDEVIRTR